MGYTKIDNDLFRKCLPKQELTGSEFRVLLFIISDTLCFSRKHHEMASSYISIYTGLSTRQIKRAIESLCEKGLIKIKQKGKGTHPQIIEVSGDIDGFLWGHRWSFSGDIDGQKMTKNVTQEINKEINKEIKKEERVFSWEEILEKQESEEFED